MALTYIKSFMYAYLDAMNVDMVDSASFAFFVMFGAHYSALVFSYIKEVPLSQSHTIDSANLPPPTQGASQNLGTF